MVVVQVRDQHRGHFAARLRRRVRSAPAQVREPAAQHGVGEHTRAADLEQRGRMPDPGDARAGRLRAGRFPIGGHTWDAARRCAAETVATGPAAPHARAVPARRLAA